MIHKSMLEDYGFVKGPKYWERYDPTKNWDMNYLNGELDIYKHNEIHPIVTLKINQDIDLANIIRYLGLPKKQKRIKAVNRDVNPSEIRWNEHLNLDELPDAQMEKQYTRTGNEILPNGNILVTQFYGNESQRQAMAKQNDAFGKKKSPFQ